MKSLVLHCGFPKTGTTTLQKHFFEKYAGFRNLAKPNYPDPNVKNAISSIKFDSDMQYKKEDSIN